LDVNEMAIDCLRPDGAGFTKMGCVFVTDPPDLLGARSTGEVCTTMRRPQRLLFVAD
jgi:hypothetical protein